MEPKPITTPEKLQEELHHSSAQNLPAPDATETAASFYEQHGYYPSDQRHIKLGGLLKKHFCDDSDVAPK